MKKRMGMILLALVMLLCVFTQLTTVAEAATVSGYEPYATIDYDYSPTVECGTIRYISQKAGTTRFYSDYWGSWVSQVSRECSTSCISMSLSYIGINQTPEEILDWGNGLTYFTKNWGGATSKAYTYSSLSTAFKNYINGEGKYSPPIIHLDKYSYSGHYVLLVGQVGSKTYQVLDPATLTMWTIKIDGATATYSDPYSGASVTDNIDNTGDDVYQWYNSSAKLPGYVSECTKYDAHCVIKTVTATNARSQPCGSDTDSDSVKIASVSKGTTFTATALIKNTLGDYWYQITTADGKTAYVLAQRMSFVKDITSDIIIHDVEAPVVLKKGDGFAVGGIVKATHNRLTKLSAYVYAGTDTDGTVKTGGAHSVNTRYYSLKGSNVDNQLLFRKLTSGTYTYAIYADYSNSYINASGVKKTNTGEICLYTGTLYVNETGDKWLKEDGRWVCYEAGEKVVSGWAKDGTKWCYMNSKGYMTYNKWVKDGSKWCYIGSDGYMVTSRWVKDGDEWCYIDKHGYMVTNGWAKDSYGWCYMGSDGYMVENRWVKDGSKWCYIGSDGYMVTSRWVKDGSKWCYIGSDGYMVTNGWAKDGTKWCYMDANGYMTYNKWVKDGDEWCYIGSDGYMVTNDWAKDGKKWCYMDKNGYMTKSEWVKYDGDWYYLDADGYMVTGTKKIDGKTYKFSSSGVLIS